MADESIFNSPDWRNVMDAADTLNFAISNMTGGVLFIKPKLKEVEIEEITQNQKCKMCLRPGCKEHSEKDLIGPDLLMTAFYSSNQCILCFQRIPNYNFLMHDECWEMYTPETLIPEFEELEIFIEKRSFIYFD